jgi:non-specific serine/threonine protein kinase
MVGSSLEPARGELGIDAAAIAWKNGNGLTLDGAIEAALTWLETSRRAPEAGQWSPPRVAQTATGLTRREMEIAALVGHGLRNRDIAKKLYLSARTVDAHIEHIRNKLDFHSRSQIAAWAVARGLVHD